MTTEENEFLTDNNEVEEAAAAASAVEVADAASENTEAAEEKLETAEAAGLEYGQPTEAEPALESPTKQFIDEVSRETVEQTAEDDSAVVDATETLSEDGFTGVVNVEQTADLLDMRSRHEAGEALTEQDIDKIANLAVSYLRQILACFGETKSIIDEYEGDDGELILEINGGDLAILIGRHGHTLSSLQQVVSSYVAKHIGFRYPVVVDIEGYRDRHKNIVADIAQKAARRAKERGKSVSLKPMNAYERRLVHVALRDDDELETYSKGEDPYRFVVINFKKPAKGFEEASEAEGEIAVPAPDVPEEEGAVETFSMLETQDGGSETEVAEDGTEESAE